MSRRPAAALAATLAATLTLLAASPLATSPLAAQQTAAAATPPAGPPAGPTLASLLSGSWELDLAQSDFGPMPRPASMTRRMAVTPQALDMTITQRTPGGEIAGTFRCPIGGEACRNAQGGSETTGAARWERGSLVVTTTLARLIGPNLTTVDRYRVTEDGRVLTMERTFEAGGATSGAKGRLVFTRR